MNGNLLILSVTLIPIVFTHTVEANDLPETNQPEVINDIITNGIIESLSLADQQNVRLNYQPFDSGFNLSVGTTQYSNTIENTQSYTHSLTYNTKTFLGVGWKQLVKDVRFELGAYYQTESQFDNLRQSYQVDPLDSGLNNTFSENRVTGWQPVISLDMSYQF